MLDVLALANLLDRDASPPPPPEAVELLAQRQSARAEREFARADELRDQLRELGWEVRDGPDGPELLPDLMIIYGRNPVHEAIRGPRAVRRIWAAPGAAARAVAGPAQRDHRPDRTPAELGPDLWFRWPPGPLR